MFIHFGGPYVNRYLPWSQIPWSKGVSAVTAAFLVYVAAKKKADQRLRKQYSSNLPSGIV